MRSVGGECIQRDIADHLMWSQPLTNQYFTDLVAVGFAKNTGRRDRNCMVFALQEEKIERILNAMKA